jgi:hypothetical protein
MTITVPDLLLQTFTRIIKDILKQWGVTFDTDRMTRNDMYKALNRSGGSAKVRQLVDLFMTFKIPADRLQGLSTAKAEIPNGCSALPTPTRTCHHISSAKLSLPPRRYFFTLYCDCFVIRH